MTKNKQVLLGGSLFHPVTSTIEPKDICFCDGLISAIAPPGGLSSSHLEEAEIFQLDGQIISPGWIDVHAHVYQGFTPLGINVDQYFIERGVTTVCDAGSAGASTVAGLLQYIAAPALTRVLVWLHISMCGLAFSGMAAHTEKDGSLSFPGENDLLTLLSIPHCLNAVHSHINSIIGIKVRLGASICHHGQTERLTLQRGVEAARKASLPLMVHYSLSTLSTDEVLNQLEAGDVFTHCFHGWPGSILSWQSSSSLSPPSWQLSDEVKSAKSRGILFDVGHGGGSFQWSVTEQCASLGLWPDTISTDLHTHSCNGPAYDLPLVMSKFYHLGMTLSNILTAVTQTAANAIHRPELVQFKEGNRIPDITICHIVTHCNPVQVEDCIGDHRLLRRFIVPTYVWAKGKCKKLHYELPHLSGKGPVPPSHTDLPYVPRDLSPPNYFACLPSSLFSSNRRKYGLVQAINCIGTDTCNLLGGNWRVSQLSDSCVMTESNNGFFEMSSLTEYAVERVRDVLGIQLQTLVIQITNHIMSGIIASIAACLTFCIKSTQKTDHHGVTLVKEENSQQQNILVDENKSKQWSSLAKLCDVVFHPISMTRTELSRSVMVSKSVHPIALLWFEMGQIEEIERSQKGLLTLQETIEICHNNNVYVIYIETLKIGRELKRTSMNIMIADVSIISFEKGIESRQDYGLVIASDDLMTNEIKYQLSLNNLPFEMGMKASKEIILSLLTDLDNFLINDFEKENNILREKRVKWAVDLINAGCSSLVCASLSWDSSQNQTVSFPSLFLHIKSKSQSQQACDHSNLINQFSSSSESHSTTSELGEIVTKLLHSHPPIYVRSLSHTPAILVSSQCVIEAEWRCVIMRIIEICQNMVVEAK
jgi:dihydroorotase